jgi:hypothetical protein
MPCLSSPSRRPLRPILPPSHWTAYHPPIVPRSPASSIRAVLPLALGALLALPSASTLASTLAPSGRQRSEALIAEGDADAAKGAWDEAISKYRASFYGLTPADQASYLGSLPVRKAMRAYAERITQEQDPDKRRALLERQRVLLEEFLDAVAGKPGAADEVGTEVITELEETRSSIDAELQPKTPDPPEGSDGGGDPPPDPDPGAATTPDSTLRDSPTPADEPRRDWLGLGLIIGGSTTLAAGLGVGVGWFTIRSTAEALVDAASDDFPPGSDERASYLAGEEARAKKFLIAGSVVAGVGLATAIGGVVRLVVHRRRSTSSRSATAYHLSPLVSATTTGLVLHRRF